MFLSSLLVTEPSPFQMKLLTKLKMKYRLHQSFSKPKKQFYLILKHAFRSSTRYKETSYLFIPVNNKPFNYKKIFLKWHTTIYGIRICTGRPESKQRFHWAKEPSLVRLITSATFSEAANRRKSIAKSVSRTKNRGRSRESANLLQALYKLIEFSSRTYSHLSIIVHLAI